jgi:aspartate/methionine/tyrosine aminotransferase
MNHPERLQRRVSARMADIDTFHVVAVVTRAKELEAAGRSIVNMAIGEPDGPIADPIAEAGIRAIRAGLVRYTGGLGIPELRRGLAGWYQRCRPRASPSCRVRRERCWSPWVCWWIRATRC